MLTIILLLIAASAVAALFVIDGRVYEGFDSAPEGAERLLAITATPAFLLFVLWRLAVQKVTGRRPDFTFGDLRYYAAWAFSSDKA